ncbi:hypothetical protein ABZV14_11505 [Streptosporangium canum]
MDGVVGPATWRTAWK